MARTAVPTHSRAPRRAIDASVGYTARKHGSIWCCQGGKGQHILPARYAAIASLENTTMYDIRWGYDVRRLRYETRGNWDRWPRGQHGDEER